MREGIELASGDLLIIQDADLEYDPQDYRPMLEALLQGRGDIVYGSRYMRTGGTPTSRGPRISAAAASASSRAFSRAPGSPIR